MPLPSLGPPQRPCQPWTDVMIGTDLPDSCTPEIQAQSFDIATELLWKKSGRRYSTCEVVVRPCPRWAAGQGLSWLTSPWMASYMSTDWSLWPRFWALPVACGLPGHDPAQDCGCRWVHRVELGKTPVVAVNRVKIDGLALPATAYKVDGWRWLTRTDGAAWPMCQDTSADDDQAGTWSVDYVYGQAPPPSGVAACGEFAHAVALLLAGEANSGLPGRVQNLSRQGVQITYVSLQDLLNSGVTALTALPLTNQFLVESNPSNLRSRARVYRADARPASRVSGRGFS